VDLPGWAQVFFPYPVPGTLSGSNGVLVVATRPVSVLAFSSYPDCGKECAVSFLALPVQTLGRRYLAAAPTQRSLYAAAVTVVASEPGTRVSVGGGARGPLNRTLDALQTLTVSFAGDQGPPYSGPTVLSDRPVAAVLWYTSTAHGFAAAESLLPAESWGTEFPLASFQPSPQSVFFVSTLTDGTVVSVNGQPRGSLGAGCGDLFHLDPNAELSFLQASSPVQVMQVFVNSSGSIGYLAAMPSMQQLGGNVLVNVTSSAGYVVNVVTHAYSTFGILLDSFPILADWKETMGYPAAVSTFHLPLGVHYIHSLAKATTFSTIVYEVDNYDYATVLSVTLPVLND
jgi:IgGFc binding protein